MTKTWSKVVYTRVREFYLIEADTAEEAEANWQEGELIASECEGIEEDYPVEEDY